MILSGSLKRYEVKSQKIIKKLSDQSEIELISDSRNLDEVSFYTGKNCINRKTKISEELKDTGKIIL